MKYKALGKTGLFLSEVGLGTMTFGQATGQYAATTGVTQSEAQTLIKRAVDEGINFIDTANVYTQGQSEEIIGRSIQSAGISRHELVIATKANHATGKGPNDSGSSRYHLMRELEQSLKRLDTDYIDLYQLHGWDPVTPLDETWRALDDMVQQGWVRYVGVSNWAAWQIEKALGVAQRADYSPLQSVQAYYSLVGRDIERELVPMAGIEQVGLLVYSPLAGGYLSGKYQDEQANGWRTTIEFPPLDPSKGAPVLAALSQISTVRQESMASIALAWLLHQPVVTSVILGIRNERQFDQNLNAIQVRLSPDELKTLDQASALSLEYPAWSSGLGETGRKVLLATGQLP